MRGAGPGGRAAPGKSDEWYTPPAIITALGGWQAFDLDPCAPIVQPHPTALRRLTLADDGLVHAWRGRVWLNPPYSQRPYRAFMQRMAAHMHGTALIFARTETGAFATLVWDVATALLFLRGRLSFLGADGQPKQRTNRDGSAGGPENAGAPSVLVAYGLRDADVLAGCGLVGAFVPLRIPRGVLVLALEPRGSDETDAPATWREVIAAQVRAAGRAGVRVADLYRALASHPKARRNPNWQAKVRQQLQQGPFVRVRRGEYREASAA